MPKDFDELRKKLIAETKKKVKESISEDNLITQAVNCIDESDRTANTLAKRLREWYSFYCPEFSNSIASHPKFIELIQKKTKKELLKEINVKPEDSMGADLKKEDVDAILELAKAINRLYEVKELQTKYLEKVMKAYCPNITAVAGPLIGAKLLAIAGSLKKLSSMPSSTIQLLGAEKALFRHLTTGAKSPKYGILHEHTLISQAKKSEHGKIARLLADKIAIAAKVDFFKGKFVGDNLNDEIKRRLKK
ncbi:NOP58 family protein [Candidatus Woesearchaeota archaeon]|nr:NOP58 family protein [Candidatus Woesearchaeota archaeon]